MDDIILNESNYEEIRTQIYAYAIKEYWIMARRIAKELRTHRKLDIYLMLKLNICADKMKNIDRYLVSGEWDFNEAVGEKIRNKMHDDLKTKHNKVYNFVYGGE